jgi:hypothetical protein
MIAVDTGLPIIAKANLRCSTWPAENCVTHYMRSMIVVSYILESSHAP